MSDVKLVPSVAIVDYGLGNLFSVMQACQHAGLNPAITADKQEILAADAVILPGVGAFGNAVDALRRLDLVSPLRDVAATGRPLVGICLGLQLLMTESEEFGQHQGLGIVPGRAVRFRQPTDSTGRRLKVPQVAWNRVYRARQATGGDGWSATPLQGMADGEWMYFVHSYYVQPVDAGVVLSTSSYGDVEFCSSLRVGNVFACQFHPERSGTWGLHIYKNLALMIDKQEDQYVRKA